MQIALFPELSASGAYQNMVTAMDTFFRYFFAYSTTNQGAKIVARVIINIMIKHAYLETATISDKGSTFVSQVKKEVADVPGIILEHATTKHAETIGMLKKTHAASKKAFKIETGEQTPMWNKFVNLAVLNYSTSDHTTIRFEPRRVFHRRFPYNVLDSKMGVRPHTMYAQFLNCLKCS